MTSGSVCPGGLCMKNRAMNSPEKSFLMSSARAHGFPVILSGSKELPLSSLHLGNPKQTTIYRKSNNNVPSWSGPHHAQIERAGTSQITTIPEGLWKTSFVLLFTSMQTGFLTRQLPHPSHKLSREGSQGPLACHEQRSGEKGFSMSLGSRRQRVCFQHPVQLWTNWRAWSLFLPNIELRG